MENFILLKLNICTETKANSAYFPICFPIPFLTPNLMP